MDRSTRWFYTGVALALEAATPLAPITADTPDPRAPGTRDRCPVCGTFVAWYPEWVAQIVYQGGGSLYFDGCRDLFTYLLDPGRPTRGPGGGRMARIVVTRYADGRHIDARRATFVAGSDVLGPRGAELVAHASTNEALDFARLHGGTAVVGFNGVTRELLATLE